MAVNRETLKKMIDNVPEDKLGTLRDLLDEWINDEMGKIILRRNEPVTLPEGVDPEFMDILNDVIKEHNKAFKGLVNR